MSAGKNLIYVLTRPQYEDKDVTHWAVDVNKDGEQEYSVEKPINVDAILISIPKGTTGISFSVQFVDSSGNASKPYVTPEFDVVDDVPPSSPQGLDIMYREELEVDESDDDVAHLFVNEDESEDEDDVSGDEDEEDEEEEDEDE